MNISTRFIIIDDDEFNNKICTVTIEKISKEVDIKTFLDPLEGFIHIVTEYGKSGNSDTAILFLDINMPVMNGWEFLEKYELLNPSVKNSIKLFILSSSVDDRDIERARNNSNIVSYLAKPITKEVIVNLVNA